MAIYARLENGAYAEVTGVYKTDGTEITEIFQGDRLVYSATNEIYGTVPLYYDGLGYDLTDYLISGNTVQDGTPSSDAPVDASGSGARTGNLWDVNELHESYNFIAIEDATVFIPNVPGISQLYFTGVNVSIPAPFTISFSGVQIDNSATNVRVRLVFDDDTVSEISVTDSSGAAIEFNSGTFTKNLKSIRLNWSSLNGGISFKNFMINSGSTALPYEPYGFKLPLTVNGTEYPIYLGTVPTTRRVKKLVLTGEELWNIYQNTYYITVSGYYRLHDVGHHLSVCSHFPIKQEVALPEMCYGLGGLIDEKAHTAWNGNIVFNPSPMISSLADWKSYLREQYAAGTPVTVWYVLAEPETAVVNEPLMKIGDYADTVSFAQAGVTIPTVSGANVLGMASPVKPSEVYVKGKGIKQNRGQS